jgi:hypothetical protein
MRWKKEPRGYTWHHHQNGKTLMLVPTDLHDAVKHGGGVANSREPSDQVHRRDLQGCGESYLRGRNSRLPGDQPMTHDERTPSLGEMVTVGTKGPKRRRVASATVRIMEPENVTIEKAPEGHLAIHLDLKAEEDEEGRAPRLTIGPLCRPLRSLEDALGRIVLPSGYDRSLGEHVVTLYVRDHETLGKTTIELGPSSHGRITVRVEAREDDGGWQPVPREAPIRVTVETTANLEVLAPWTSDVPPQVPPPGPLRLEPSHGAVSLWLGKRTSYRSVAVYLHETQDDHGMRCRFASDCGFWSLETTKPADLMWSAGPGIAAVASILRIHRSDRQGQWVEEAARRAQLLGIDHASAYIRLRGYRFIEGAPPWPAESPVVAIGTF